MATTSVRMRNSYIPNWRKKHSPVSLFKVSLLNKSYTFKSVVVTNYDCSRSLRQTQVVCHWSHISQAGQVGFCNGQCGNGSGFYPSTLSSPYQYYSKNASKSYLIYIEPTAYNAAMERVFKQNNSFCLPDVNYGNFVALTRYQYTSPQITRSVYAPCSLMQYTLFLFS
jgi:hypothetical protein